MAKFSTYNQFDKKFEELGHFSNDRTACPLFALITAKNFMETGDISQQQHENNICAAVMNYITNNVPKYIAFDELLAFTDGTFSENDIMVTSPELLTQGIVGYDSIFKPANHKQNYSVIFLKNRNFIVVMVKFVGENPIYALRDCHEKEQNNFENFQDLKLFMDKSYQFEQLTIVDGILIEEFSNIELLVIDKNFQVVSIDPTLYDESAPSTSTSASSLVAEKSSPLLSPTNLDLDFQIAQEMQFDTYDKLDFELKS